LFFGRSDVSYGSKCPTGIKFVMPEISAVFATTGVPVMADLNWDRNDFMKRCRLPIKDSFGSCASSGQDPNNFTVRIFCQVSFCRGKISGLELIF